MCRLAGIEKGVTSLQRINPERTDTGSTLCGVAVNGERPTFGVKAIPLRSGFGPQ